MLHHSQGESAKAFVRTSSMTPLGQVSLHIQHANWQAEMDNGPWFVCMGLLLSFLYGWFANNTWFGTWVSNSYRCVHLHMQTPTEIPCWFFVCYRWHLPEESVFIKAHTDADVWDGYLQQWAFEPELWPFLNCFTPLTVPPHPLSAHKTKTSDILCFNTRL